MPSDWEDTLGASDPVVGNLDTVAAAVRSVGETARIPAKIGHFEVIERVGSGGVGVVYAAHDPKLRRRVAIKVLIPGRNTGAAADERLIREAQAMAQLSHPNVASVFEIGTQDGNIFVAMEFIDGQSLRAWQRGRTVSRVLDAYDGAGRGLAAAHALGIVHRDFKPDNVMVGSDGRPRVLDFGLARPSLAALKSQFAVDFSNEATLTATGALLGTPAYMSPEQFAGAEADARTDQFAFCVALYEALFDVRPFAAETLGSLIEQVLRGQLRETPSRADVPAPVLSAITRGLAVDPANRFDSMPALLDALRPVAKPRRWLAGGLVAALGATGVLAVAMRSDVPDFCRDASPMSLVWPRTASAGTEPHAARLDAYVAAWTDARTSVCAARPAADAQGSEHAAAQHACLRRQLDLFSATIDRIPTARADEVDEVLRRLAPAGRCTGEILPAVSDVDALSAIDVGFAIAAASALDGRSELVEAVAAARHAVEAAQASGDEVLRATALQGLSTALWLQGDSAASLEPARAAADAADRSGDVYAMAIAYAGFAATASVLGEAEIAADSATRVVATAGRVQGDAQVDGWRAYALGTLALGSASGRDAVALLEQAVTDWTAALGGDAFEVIVALNNLALAHFVIGEHEAAANVYQRQVAIVETRFGVDTIGLRYPLSMLAQIEITRGNLELARRYALRAFALVDERVPVGSAERMSAHAALANVLSASGDVAAAVPHYESAIAESRAVYGDDSVAVALGLHQWGVALHELGSREATGVLTRAVATMEAALSGKALRDNPEYAAMRASLAEAQSQRPDQPTR